jgi:transcriptional regulator with PAS, ATPase and Fis domain
VPVNCGAIPDTLIDSQLFGHARGAFSGATSDHDGLVRAAEGGTLLLDEVGELSEMVQLRLLRLLEEREIQPVGYSRPVQVNVRIIAATIGDLRQAVDRGTFREDLYFRLDVVSLPIRPLHERATEIPDLLDRFNEDFARIYQQLPLVFTTQTRAVLNSYEWPGNIRQLRALVERLHVLCPDERITPRHLVDFGQLDLADGDSPKGTQQMQQAKHAVVTEVLRACGGNVSHAASALGVHRSTLYRWLSERRMLA